MLNVSKISVRYAREGPAVLSHLDLTAMAGECVALVGPSGSGKTTLLRAINSTVAIESGEVWGGDVRFSTARGRALREIRSRIAFIAQKHDLVDRLKVYQNVMAGALGRWSTAHALRFLAWPKASELDEARDALDSVSLAHKLRHRTTELSGGEQQRVAIARALANRPKVLLADEPTGNLDVATAETVFAELMTSVREVGVAALIATHNPDLANRMDRMIGILDGRIVEYR